MSRRSLSWVAAVAVAAAAFLYGALDDGPPKTNADRAHALAQNFACPVCAGQSVAESDVPVAREIRRQIAVWVDEGRGDDYIRDQLVSAYDSDIDYNPSGSGVTSLVWILPVVAAAAAAAVVVTMLRTGRRSAEAEILSSGTATPSDVSASVVAGEEVGGLAVVGEEVSGSAVFSAPVMSAGSGRSWRAVLAWTVVIVLVAGAAGVLVARFSGSRGDDGSITGDIRNTTRELIFEAQRLFGEGDMEAAIAAYDEALELQPSNAEALTYRGWLASRSGGDLAEAARYLDDAIAVDPGYADARLFRAIVALESQDADRAAAEIAVFDSLDPPPFAQQLVAQAQVRERIAAASDAAAWQAVAEVFESPDDSRPAFGATGLSEADALAAVEHLGAQGRVLDGLRVLDWVLDSHPQDAQVRAARGWLLARTRDPELADRGIDLLDDALDADPSNPWALVYSAVALHNRNGPGDRDAARERLARFNASPQQPAELVALIDSQALRESLR